MPLPIQEPVGAAPKIYYYHNDHLGSPRAISDKDGKVVESYFYYPFGSGGPVGGPSFTGKELDATGLFYFGARYYDPALGRFITPDPVQIPGNNLYVYCANNPLVYVDPDGEILQFIWAVWKFYTAARTLYNVYEAYKYGGWEYALMSTGRSFILSQFGAGISDAINFGDWGGVFGDVLEWGVEGAITGGIQSVMSGGDFWEGAQAGAISSAKWGAIGYLGGKLSTLGGNPNDPTDPMYSVNSLTQGSKAPLGSIRWGIKKLLDIPGMIRDWLMRKYGKWVLSEGERAALEAAEKNKAEIDARAHQLYGKRYEELTREEKINWGKLFIKKETEPSKPEPSK